MGSWPEFNKCCGFVSLRTGTFIIGIFTIVSNLVSLSFYAAVLALSIRHIGSSTAEPEPADSSEETVYEHHAFGYLVVGWSLLICLLEIALAVIMLFGINEPGRLRKVVYFMSVLWLLDLMLSLVNTSRDAFYEAYINAIQLLISAYFILVIRSTYLELEGRLEDSQSLRSFSRDSFMAFNNPVFRPPPPNYDEAVRMATVNMHIPLTDTSRADDIEGQAATLAIVEHTMANPKNSGRTQLITQGNQEVTEPELFVVSNTERPIGI